MMKGCLLLAVTPLLVLTFVLGAVFLRGCSAPGDLPPLLDRDGRIVLYHGINVSNYSKYAPDFLPWHTKEDFTQLRDWGFNLVRYLVFWEAIEPVPGEYNEAYIAAVLERFQWLEDLGIDVLVDLHQDLYARRFTGDGFPDWTVNDGGHPFTPREPWNLNYAEPAVRAAYRHFWGSADLKGRYISMMAYLMNHLEGRKNVIGIDIMNEPWPSPILGFEKNVLTPFYEDIQKMRRLNSYTTPLFFEPVIYTSTGVPSGLRFKPAPDAVYAPHYYDPLCHEGYPYTRFGKVLMRLGVNIRLKEARDFGVPALYGEFGISPNVRGYDKWLNDFLGLLRQHHVGWTYYSLDKSGHEGFAVLDEQGAPRWIILDHLIWAYPQRVAGTRLKTEYGDNYLILSYDPIDSKAPSVLYIPEKCDNIRILVNGQPVPFKPGQRYFEHQAKPGDGRQTIEARWGSD